MPSCCEQAASSLSSSLASPLKRFSSAGISQTLVQESLACKRQPAHCICVTLCFVMGL